MAFHPNMADYPVKVVATDKTRPGWRYIWGGCQRRDQGEAMAEAFRRQDRTSHLTFTVEERK